MLWNIMKLLHYIAFLKLIYSSWITATGTGRSSLIFSLVQRGVCVQCYTITEHDLWRQPVVCYLSWLCSSCISELCSVTVFRNCWLVCVWHERQDCHLSGMTANAAPTLKTTQPTLSPINISMSFYMKPWRASVGQCYSPCNERNRLFAWTLRGKA